MNLPADAGTVSGTAPTGTSLDLHKTWTIPDLTSTSLNYQVEGYTFKEWIPTYSVNGVEQTGAAYGNGVVYTQNVAHDVVLTASWERKGNIAVNFHQNKTGTAAGDVVVGTSTLNFMDEVVFPNITLNGYTLEGWTSTLHPILSPTDTYSGTLYNNTTAKAYVNRDQTMDFYALWRQTVQNYSYSFGPVTDATFVGSPLTTGTIAYGDSLPLLGAGTVNRTGYLLTGWSASTTGNTYTPGGVYPNQSTDDVVFTAIFTPQKYDIVFEKGSPVFTDGTSGTVTGSMANQEVTFGVATALNNNGYNATGFTFDGRPVKAPTTDTHLYKNAEDYTLTTTGVTLVAQWTVQETRLEYRGNGATSSTGDTFQKFEPTTTKSLLRNMYQKKGYTFMGWSKTQIPVDPTKVVADFTSMTGLL